MADLDVAATITIGRPPEVVRRQFADVAHHEATGLHRGVRFQVVEDVDGCCRYRQVSRVGPLRLTQELELVPGADGPLVNTIRRGQFRGGTITFTVTGLDDGRSEVEARVRSPLRRLEVLARPLLRSTVRRSLVRALREDRADLEGGTYPSDPSPG